MLLYGQPGVGKTAIAAYIGEKRSEVIASHFCVHGHQEKANPSRAVLSLAYQMAAYLPEYQSRLQRLALEESGFLRCFDVV